VPRYELSEYADEDLISIWSYVAERNPVAAEKLIRRIDAACERLVDMPFMGRARGRRLRGLRSWVVGSYVIFYRPVGATIKVVRILHGARDIPAILGDKQS
jgi:toxin ParE1/3/4